MSTKPVPDEWAKPMRKLGYAHRGQPSISRLAREADLSVETVRRYIHRIGDAEAGTIAALSKAMRQDVSDWVGSKEAGELYVGPDSSRWLDDRQRVALTELINSFVKGVPDAGQSAQKSAGPAAGTDPATGLGSVFPSPGSSPDLPAPPAGQGQRPRR